jgi:hypothetical protein
VAFAFSGPSGVMVGQGAEMEPDGQIQARMTSYTNGNAPVRIGR